MKLHVLETGKFKLDGGAMFGVVPKRMWQKMHPADDDNLCTWQMRCLLVEDGNRKILIDTGVGSKQDDRFRSHFYPHDDIDFTESLAKIGLTTEDITDVFLTHFHFDHVGGALKRDAQGAIVPVFPNAT
ncbi:MAG: MBL fold metallo-hydrolase, partial [Saprospiraceae bacterium]|nr:MBL fold metallo-hydrolase [Saprospiraceae bacterium]